MDSQNGNANNGLARNLSMFAVWGLSFGYAVGWGAFVMPGAEFLPSAGPAGTAIGILIGTLAMTVIGWNYHRMVSASPGPGGAYAYALNAFGADCGYQGRSRARVSQGVSLHRRRGDE